VRVWLFAIVQLGLLAVFAELGYRLGRRVNVAEGDPTLSQAMSWQATLLGLLGLLIGFSFAMAVARFDARRQLVVDEANAIGTAYLRADVLDDAAAREVRELLRRYVDVRLEFYEAGVNRARVQEANRTSSTLQQRIWSRVVAAGREDPHAMTRALLVQATNEMIDAEGRRRSALYNHVPVTVFTVIVLVSVWAVGLLGYTSGLARKRLWFATAAMPLLIAVVVSLVFDLDRPRMGLVREGQQSMMNLKASL
jgi:hypothetical protein